ncbi:MAG TPA: hypothetical protein VNE18_09915, partial [Rhodanobacter sp.]|nr:hypothetical protein [Rhodanobacter sp.]
SGRLFTPQHDSIGQRAPEPADDGAQAFVGAASAAMLLPKQSGSIATEVAHMVCSTDRPALA